jgi:phenylalanyl-tRNA synthetase beta chain
MKIAYSWLQQFIDTHDSTPAHIEQLLTNCGLEVENYEAYSSVKGGLQGLVTGEVLTCQPHPNADRLRVTTVNAGGETPLQIVCGAPNVAAGQKVIVAMVGATLYPTSGEPFKITKSKIRGEVSEGMICAEDEIGLGQSHAGIMVLPEHTAVGLPAAQVLPVHNDTIFEIGLTPNRGDAASHLGVARDLRAVQGWRMKEWRKTLQVPETPSPVTVKIEDTDACPRYSGISISGVKVQESPAWLKQALASIGLSSINNIVDVTNYVLHSIGQPIHAFDAHKIEANTVVVKRAVKGSTFVTLDGKERQLNGEELMICNSAGPMALAGVFGGAQSGITENTTEVFVESAYFNPAVIRKSARSHGLSTDASFRYERGTDPDITVDAALFTAALIMEVAGGKLAGALVDEYPDKIIPHTVAFDLDRFYKLAGKNLGDEQVKKILSSLDIIIQKEEGRVLHLSVPAYRTDVQREVDVAEEVMRIYGYNNIEVAQSIVSCISVSDEDKIYKLKNRVADYLAHAGFYEMYGFSLTASSNYTEEEKATLVNILNPLSNELDVLRGDMLFYALQTVQYNRNRKQTDVLFYEFGKVYQKTASGYYENNRLILIGTGNQTPVNWTQPARPVSYFFMKNMLEQVLSKCGVSQWQVQYSNTSRVLERAEILVNKKAVGAFGLVEPKLAGKYDISQPVYYIDLDWDALSAIALAAKFSVTPVSKFPEVRRDLSMLLDKQVQFAQLEEIARQTERKLLREVSVFDVYLGDKLPEGKKSYALSFILQDEEKTLTDEVIDKVMNKLMANYKQQVQAEIRQ